METSSINEDIVFLPGAEPDAVDQALRELVARMHDLRTWIPAEILGWWIDQQHMRLISDLTKELRLPQ